MIIITYHIIFCYFSYKIFLSCDIKIIATIEIDITESQMEKVLVTFRPKSADHSTFQQLRACSPRYKSARSLESQLVCLKSLILCALHQNDHVLIQVNIL